MKKINRYSLILFIALLFVGSVVSAQDSRNRAMSTIVADGLAQLPAQDNKTYNQVIGELANTGAEGMQMIIDMMVPADKGKNATFEYAIDGIVSYVTAPQNENLRAAVRKGLLAGLEKCSDNTNKAFLLSQLQLIATINEAPVFEKYLSDKYLSDFAIRGLITIPGSEDVILNLMKEGKTSKGALAYAAYCKKLKPVLVENILLSWTKEADEPTLAAIYNALTVCGSAGSLPTMKAAAQKVNYTSEASGATDAYLCLLSNLLDRNQQKLVVKAAKELLKNDKTCIRCAALQLLLRAQGNNGVGYVLSALKDTNKDYRNAALNEAMKYMDNNIVLNKVCRLLPSLSEGAQVDVVSWLGNNHVVNQIDLVDKAMLSSNDVLANAAIYAAGQIGGQKALNALVTQLSGKHAQEANRALLAFHGRINESVLDALNGDSATQVQALKLVSVRHLYKAYDKVIDLLQSDNQSIRDAAYDALSGVTAPNNFDQICDLMEKSDKVYVSKIQTAAKNAIAKETADEQYRQIAVRMDKSGDDTLYYPLLAQAGNSDAITKLMLGYNTDNKKEAAYRALLDVNNTQMIKVLYDMAADNSGNNDAILERYISLIRPMKCSADSKCEYYLKALALNISDKMKNALVQALGETKNIVAFSPVVKYLDTPATALAAAIAVKNIAAKNIIVLQGESIKEALIKAQEIFKKQTDADSGYALDELNGLISKVKVDPNTTFVLPKEEKKQGYEVLFDGISLDKWQGNTTAYQVVDGSIYVSANYGSTGNLYTKKKFSDFVYKFEFCFMTEGVNNGIGIRTKIGVDAAYDGMEIQVLDHDAPIYKDLYPYQNHGAVYGVIVPKHIQFGPLGTWNTEEIRAVGDRITVTVNGVVILDGNIREACQGHNIAPDGSKLNSYMIDHKNHPGLFNKDGYISFCGHGAGVKFRNVRILELSKSVKK